MLTTSGKLILGAALAVTPPVLILKLPHALLALCLFCGQLDGRSIPVGVVRPSHSAGEVISLRCGELSLQAPANVAIKSQSPSDDYGLTLSLDGLTCRIPPPRHYPGSEDTQTEDWSDTFNRRGIEWLAASCRTNENDLSVWMDQDEVASLRERLEAKMFLSLSAERIEVVDNGSLCGLLLIWNSQDQINMSLEYFAPDLQVSGTLVISLSPPTQANQEAARALVTSLRIEQTPAGLNRRSEPLVVAYSGLIRPITPAERSR